MTEFTPWASLIGGVMIGLAAVLLMLWEGRIAGISGIASRLLPPYRDRAFASRFGFSAGIITVPLLMSWLKGAPISQTISSNVPLMIVAGLIVGFGAVCGNGCPSGHGVCGLSRLSPRSLVATMTFMVTAFVTVFIVRHVMGG